VDAESASEFRRYGETNRNRKEDRMREKLTAVFRKSRHGYIGYVEELPGANTQGRTLQQTKKNLIEAIQLVLEANRLMAEEEQKGAKIIKEKLGEITA
jgi:predicted RNase H-like HicB family nuclease